MRGVVVVVVVVWWWWWWWWWGGEGGQRFVCQIQIVIVLLEYKVEGDRTDTDGLFRDGIETDI